MTSAEGEQVVSLSFCAFDLLLKLLMFSLEESQGLCVWKISDIWIKSNSPDFISNATKTQIVTRMVGFPGTCFSEQVGRRRDFTPAQSDLSVRHLFVSSNVLFLTIHCR
jgi:hypothetical protein